MSKHTPEPWHIQPDPWPPSIRDGEHGAEIAYAKSPYTNPEYRTLERANGDRIVACVNACTGLADPAAEIKAMREKIAALEAVVMAAENYIDIYTAKKIGRISVASDAYHEARSRVTLPPSPTSDGAGEGGGNERS